MDTDELVRDLGLVQLSDSLFPTGMYSTSSGLESMFLQRQVASKSDLAEFISVQIAQQLGPCDCVALANAVELSKGGRLEQLLELDATVLAIRGVRAAREASVRSGTQLLKTVRRLKDDPLIPALLDNSACTYPVAFGACSHVLGIGVERALLSFLYGFAASIVGAALRLGMIQHFEGQEVLHELKPAMASTVRSSRGRKVAEMWQFMPHIEIFQMQHERMDSRMFIT